MGLPDQVTGALGGAKGMGTNAVLLQQLIGMLSKPGALGALTSAFQKQDLGNVVQSVRSTSEGQYRFKNVDAGKYKVRIRKEGFAPVEQEVSAAKGAEAAADVSIK